MASVNDMNFTQVSTILNSINAQATGTNPIAPVNTAEFVSVAQTTLKMGYDPVLKALSQVLNRTIFSIRPYSRKFRGLEITPQKFDAITRKVNAVDKSLTDDDRMLARDSVVLPDGTSVDPWIINKPEIIQTNFYGQAMFQKQLTIFRDQLDSAFSGPDQFAEFISLCMTNAQNQIEQAHENIARATVGNLIGGIIGANHAPQVVKLLSEYNDRTGLELDNQTVYDPANYPDFIRWVYGRIGGLVKMMAERSSIYHLNIEGKPIMRHTPADRLRAYIYTPAQMAMESQVLATTYNDNYLKLTEHELVNYWQSIETPDSIDVNPVWMTNTGALTDGAQQIQQDNIFGVLMDDEAAGYAIVDHWTAATPMNARGGYSNMFFHFRDKYFNDFTENAVVLLLE